MLNITDNYVADCGKRIKTRTEQITAINCVVCVGLNKLLQRIK